jgi:hypothetical protein
MVNFEVKEDDCTRMSEQTLFGVQETFIAVGARIIAVG